MSQVLESPQSASLMPRALFTAEEVADVLVISETLVRQMALDGELPCRRIGRLVRYTIADLEMLMATREEHRYTR